MNPIWLLAPMMLCWRPAYDGATRGWCEQRWTMRMLQPAHPAYVESPRPSSKAAQQVARVGRDDRLEPTGRAGRRSPASWGKFLFAPWSIVTKDGIPHPMPPLLRPTSSTKKRHKALPPGIRSKCAFQLMHQLQHLEDGKPSGFQRGQTGRGVAILLCSTSDCAHSSWSVVAQGHGY